MAKIADTASTRNEKNSWMSCRHCQAIKFQTLLREMKRDGIIHLPAKPSPLGGIPCQMMRIASHSIPKDAINLCNLLLHKDFIVFTNRLTAQLRSNSRKTTAEKVVGCSQCAGLRRRFWKDSDKFGVGYLKSCIEREIQTIAEQDGETKE